MIKVKVYYYDSSKTDNGYRGTDYSNFVLQGATNKEDITQELDFSEITLMGIEKATAFEPSSKFIIDIEENGSIIETLHRVVKEDYVSKPILNGNYYSHEISLLEPSVIAQKQIVDNIACTYKLKDVSLSTKTTFDINQQAILTQNTLTEYDYNGIYANDGKDNISFSKYFVWGGNAFFVGKNYNEITTTYIDNTEFTGETGIIRLPQLSIQHSEEGGNTCTYIGDASYDYTIKISQYGIDKGTITGSIISNSNLNRGGVLDYLETLGNTYSNYSNSYLIEDMYFFADSEEKILIFKYTDTNITTAPTYDISVPIGNDYEYTISFSLKILDKKEVGLGETEMLEKSILPTYFFKHFFVGRTGTKTIQSFSLENFNAGTYYFVYDTNEVEQVLTSGQKYSALLFLQKVLMNNGLHTKISDTYAGNVNFSGTKIAVEGLYKGYVYWCQYYIDENFVDILAKTEVIENFYSQKNLWELLIEVGYYIHAIPEIKFGEANKLMITFNKLGETTETSNNSTPLAITNFRGIDDYIAETNSYVSNMVQLGGDITEIVVPKSSSEDYLVYNDVAEIVVSRPIIELLKVEIYSNTDKQWYDATRYFYEQNIYKLLSINYNDVPNKGIAMYYNLKDNKIVGGNYRLPQSNTNIYNDYTFKKIIYLALNNYDYPIVNINTATGYWSTININDYMFRVTYRTQDSVRTNHCRPDIRKYLNMSYSLYGTIPKWQQFNNQQDIVVDSEKFGSNIYGALIRTGNNNYSIKEWVETPTKLKKKGEILRIDNEIYYVSTVTNVYFVDHIESTVTYSKDYNQLSKVIGIPSEPRFYEISEQSSIDREVSINDYLLVTTNENNLLTSRNSYTYLQDINNLKNIILGGTQGEYSSYAITTFKGDEKVGINYTTIGEQNLKKDILSPINAYSSGNTLTYSWGMVDNFNAGDKVSSTESETTINENSVSYRSLEAVQYTDKYGKATLFDFYILKTSPEFEVEGVRNLPISPYDTNNYTKMKEVFANTVASNVVNVEHNETQITNTHSRGLILLKDCRETIRFNYNLQCITDSDTFITSPFFFTPKTKCKLALLTVETNKLSNGYIENETIADYVDIYSTNVTNITKTDAFGNSRNKAFILRISTLLANKDISNIKSIALIFDYNPNSSLGKTQFALAKNIPQEEYLGGLSKEAYLKQDWYFGSPNVLTFFKNEQ